MSPHLYYLPASPPCRAVLIAADAMGIELNEVIVNLMEGDHMTPEFLKLNPQHTVPTLVDGDFHIWDSHAIMCYLVNKYADDDSLYPKDPEKRALVDQRLYFDGSILFPSLRAAATPVLYDGVTTVSEEKIENIQKAYRFLDIFLEEKDWAAGDFLSIADFSLLTTVTTLSIIAPLTDDEYPNIINWLQHCEEIPSYELNKEGLEQFREFFDSKLNR